MRLLNFSSTLSLAFVGALLASCGNRTSTTPLSAESTAESTATAIDEAADSMSDGGSSATLTFSDLNVSPLSATFSKACTESSPNATVVVALSGSNTASLSLGPISRSVTTSFSGTETRVWAPDTGVISCNGGATAAVIPWATNDAVTGDTLTITTDGSRETSITGTRANGKTISASRKAAIKGSRVVTFKSHSVSSGVATINRTIVIDTTKTVDSTLASGTVESSVNSIKTKADAPLDVTVVRTASDVTSRTINSGTLEVTRGSNRIELVFKNVVYSHSGDESCVPVSGTVTGSYFASGATIATSTFTITAGDSTSIDATFADGTTSSFDVDASCDLKNL